MKKCILEHSGRTSQLETFTGTTYEESVFSVVITKHCRVFKEVLAHGLHEDLRKIC